MRASIILNFNHAQKNLVAEKNEAPKKKEGGSINFTYQILAKDPNTKESKLMMESLYISCSLPDC